MDFVNDIRNFANMICECLRKYPVVYMYTYYPHCMLGLTAYFIAYIQIFKTKTQEQQNNNCQNGCISRSFSIENCTLYIVWGGMYVAPPNIMVVEVYQL